jgi:hypothetical protein
MDLYGLGGAFLSTPIKPMIAAMTDDDLILHPTGIDDDRMIDDFRVFFEGRPIGRIRRCERAWDWHIDPAAPLSAKAAGSSAGLEQAKRAFRETWERLYSKLSPDDIARWHAVDDIT